MGWKPDFLYEGLSLICDISNNRKPRKFLEGAYCLGPLLSWLSPWSHDISLKTSFLIQYNPSLTRNTLCWTEEIKLYVGLLPCTNLTWVWYLTPYIVSQVLSEVIPECEPGASPVHRWAWLPNKATNSNYTPSFLQGNNSFRERLGEFRAPRRYSLSSRDF